MDAKKVYLLSWSIIFYTVQLFVSAYGPALIKHKLVSILITNHSQYFVVIASFLLKFSELALSFCRHKHMDHVTII